MRCEQCGEKIVHLEYLLGNAHDNECRLSKGWIVAGLLQAITVSKKHPNRARVLEPICTKKK